MKRRKLEVSVSVFWQDCGDSLRNGTIHDYDLQAIGETFLRAAEAIRNGEHGTVECGNDSMASIGIDRGGPYHEELGLPVIARIKIKRKRKS